MDPAFLGPLRDKEILAEDTKGGGAVSLIPLEASDDSTGKSSAALSTTDLEDLDEPLADPSRRRVGQRWYYEPVSSVSIADPVLSKRQSRPPQRLTATKLGTVSSNSDKRVRGLVTLVSDSTEGNGSSGHVEVEGSGSSPALGSSVVGRHSPGDSRASAHLSGDPTPPPVPPETEAVIATTSSNHFSIRLLFPDGGGPKMIYPVTGDMSVSCLRLQITNLMEAVHLVHLLVGPSWVHDLLDHSGLITDRCLPGTTVSCPYLQQGSMVLVYFVRPDTEPFRSPEPVPIGLSCLDVPPAPGGWWESSQQSSSSDPGLQRRERHDSFSSSSSEGSSSPDSKRPRVAEQLHDVSADYPSLDSRDRSGQTDPMVFEIAEGVSRRERLSLIKKFKREQRYCRRVYRRSVKMTWEAEIADNKENEDEGLIGLPRPSVDPEVVAEAFENYCFDRMEKFDEDAAFQLARFCSSLRVIPES